jgi:hypothetical protein
MPAALPPPELIAPAPHEVSFGRVAGRVARGTKVIRVSVGGRLLAEKAIGRNRFDFTVKLPSRDVTLRVIAVDGRGQRSSTVVGPIFGLPATAKPRGPPRSSHEDAALGRTISGLARNFPGICGIFVQDLGGGGGGAAWNARAQFPAASTLKVAIAIQALVAHRGRPPPGSRFDRLLRRMLIPSEDKPANELLTWLGGSTSGGAAKVNATLRALGLRDTEMYGGYLVQSRRPIPLERSAQPSFVGKRTTAWDFGRLLRFLHLAADGEGLLAQRFRGSLVPADARFLLYLLAHARPTWLDPGGATAVIHKPGWITRARHDGGIVYWPGGAFVAVVMTWNARGVGAASELLAARVARAAFARFRERDRAEYAGAGGKGRQHDRRGLLVAVHQPPDLTLNKRQQAGLAHHAATEQDPFWREHADHGHEPEREVMRFERPHGLVRVEVGGRPAPARLDRMTGCEPFPAVAVVGADSVERISVAVVGNPKMSEFGVDEPVQKLPARHPAPADAGADRDVTEGVEPLSRSPAMLA